MPPTPNIQLDHGDIAIEPFFDATQQFQTGAAPSLALTVANSTTVQAVASGDNDQQAVAIQGRYRWNQATVTAGHPSGAAGTYDVFVTATDNRFTLGETTVDGTDYAFAISIRAQGAFPSTPLYRKVAEVDWNGSAITALRHTIAQRRDNATIMPTSPLAGFTPLRVRGAASQTAPLAVFEDSTGAALVYIGGSGGIGVTAGPLFLAPTSGDAIQIRASGDTGSRLEISNQGRLRWGRGDGSFDAVLARGADATLTLTGQALTVVHDVRIAVPGGGAGFKLRNTADSADWYLGRQSSDRLLIGQTSGWGGIDFAPGSSSTIAFGSTGTIVAPASITAGTGVVAGTTIAGPRASIAASGNISTDGSLVFARPFVGSVVSMQQASGDNIISNRLLAADANAAFAINGVGSMFFGAGGASAIDVTLRRSAASKVMVHGEASSAAPALLLGRQGSFTDFSLGVSGSSGAWSAGDSAGDVVLLAAIGAIIIGRQGSPALTLSASGASPTVGFFGAAPVTRQATQYTNASGLSPSRALPASYTLNQLAQLVLALAQDLGRLGLVNSAY